MATYTNGTCERHHRVDMAERQIGVVIENPHANYPSRYRPMAASMPNYFAALPASSLR